MKIHFHTNLDLARAAVASIRWGSTQPPRVGERIRFDFLKADEASNRPIPASWALEVCRVEYDVTGEECRVELHIAQPYRTIEDWNTWFRKHVLGHVWKP